MPANTNRSLFAVLLALLAYCATVGAIEAPLEGLAADDTDPVSFFYSRTDIKPPALTIEVYDPEAVSDGYFFVSPWRLSETGPDRGPYIYDNSGDLIWSGAADFGPATVHNPHVCQYKGRDHICLFFCFFQGTANPGFGRGMGAILDNSYRVVKTVQSSGSVPASDMHEFNLVDGGRGALLNIFIVRQYDLSPFGASEGTGWVIESVFQEIRVETGELLFEWRSLDHEETSPKNSRLALNGNVVAGDGKTTASPWDYFHTNSIDKSLGGDYLVSGRHFAALYKISGTTGKIVWTLHGQSDNAPADAYTRDFNFSSQHDARWVSDNATHTLLTVFDNAFDGMNATAPSSRGLLIALDHIARSATLLSSFFPASPDLLAHSQGSLQLLGDAGDSATNAFVGWGASPSFSEHHAHNGTPILRGHVALPGSEVMTYRSRKHAWTGTPADAPALWTYSRDGAAGNTVFYVSWNGATTVSSWRFYAAPAASGPFAEIGVANRSGFETHFVGGNFSAWAFAEALDSSDTVLRRSAIVSAFVPSEALRPACDEWGCAMQSPDPEAPLTLPPAVEVQRPDELKWDAGLDGVRHYPKQPGRPTVGIVAQVVPPILLGLAGGLVVVLFWVCPKVDRRCFGGGRKAPGGYERVEGERDEVTERREGPRVEMEEVELVFEDSGDERGEGEGETAKR